VFGSATFSQSGERFILRHEQGRIMAILPVDEPDEVIYAEVGQPSGPPDEAVALAAAVWDAEAFPTNACLPGLRKTLFIASPSLCQLAAAAPLCLGRQGFTSTGKPE